MNTFDALRCAVMAAALVVAEAGTFAGVQVIVPPDGSAADFADAIATDGTVLAIGSSEDDDLGFASGSVSVFRWDGTEWVFEQKLLATGGQPFDRLGSSVAVSGDRIISGAPWVSGGAAHVFRWNGSSWEEEAKLVAFNDPSPFGEIFGISVAIDGDVAIVGASWDADNGVESGSASIFRWNGTAWVGEQELYAEVPAPFDEFGRAVALSGGVAVVAAPDNDDLGTNAGSVHVYRYAGGSWNFEQTLLASAGGAGDRFGYGIAVDGDAVVVGASGEEAPSSSGAAYVYRWNGAAWSEEAKLVAADGKPGDLFGYSVDIRGGHVAIGAVGVDDRGSMSGAAYLFQVEESIWSQIRKRIACDGAAGDSLGGHVAIAAQPGRLLASMTGLDFPVTDGGGALSWSLVTEASCAADVSGDGCVDGSDLGLILSSWGTCE